LKTYHQIIKGNSRNFTLKKILLLVIMAFANLCGNAQIGVGASGSLNIFSKNMGQFVSFGPLVEFNIKHKYSARPSFNFFVPKTSSGTTVGYYMGNATNGQAVNVTYSDKYRIMAFACDFKRYIKETDAFETGGFYAGVGLGLLIENIKTTYSPYDSQKYYVRTANYSTTYNQIMFRGIGGFETAYSFGSFFLESQLIIPTNSTNAEGVGVVEVPISLAFQFGYKYLIK